MALTTPQELQTLQTDITVTRATVVFEEATLLEHWNAERYQQLANFYNQLHTPATPVWRPDITRDELFPALNMAELKNTGVTTRQIELAGWFLFQMDIVDATSQAVRDNFQAIFPSSGVGQAPLTFAALNALAKKNGTYFHILYSGAPVSGARISTHYGESLTPDDVREAKKI